MKAIFYLGLVFHLFLGVFLSFFLCGTTALAVPLFGETSGTIKDGVLTLYRDDRDPKKVYFFPNSTQFSVDSKRIPLFNFVYWGLKGLNPDSDSGAYMTMTTHLASDQNQTAALHHYMSLHPEMEIAVLPIKSSKVGLSTTLQNHALGDFFKEFDFPPTAGRAEDEIGVNAVLTGLGARVFYSALKADGGDKFKFDYCYNIQGFGPAMDAMITVDLRRIYDDFIAQASSHGLFHSVEIQAEMQKLQDEHAVQISINGGDATDWELMQKVADTITSRLFKVELGANPVAASASSRLYSLNVNGIIKEELKTETWNWSRRDLEEREFCTAVSLKDLGPFIDQLVIEAKYP